MTKDIEAALNDAGFETQRLDTASVREGPTWDCKIGVTSDKTAVLQGGADLPMRNAIAEEFERQTGMEPDFIFSGWGAKLSEMQRHIVTGDPQPEIDALTNDMIDAIDAEAIRALGNYTQADEDGVMVMVSRQAVDACLDLLKQHYKT